MNQRGLKRVFNDFKLHPWLHLVSILTISVSLVLLGVFFLISRNLQEWTAKSKSHNIGTVFLKEGTTTEQVESVKSRIMTESIVKGVVFKTKHSLAEELQDFLGGTSEAALQGSEIFPDILEVELKNSASPQQSEELRAVLMTYPEVAETDFSDDWLAQVQKIKKFLTWFGFVLGIGMVVGCGFIVANFMGLRHQSRRAEIDIIQLHGANRFFVLAPFIWEGFIEGVIGSLFAIGLLFGFRGVLNLTLGSQWLSMIGSKEIVFLSPAQTALVITIGLAMAFFGSFTVFFRFQEHK